MIKPVTRSLKSLKGCSLFHNQFKQQQKLMNY
jgi:hypothetical protein